MNIHGRARRSVVGYVFCAVLAAASFCAGLATGSGGAEAKTGVILLHGKGATSMQKSPVGMLREALERAGFLVEAPDMPWSRNRGFDRDYEQSMTEIDAIVEKLKGRGATKIVVGGHSIGANAAIGYGSRRSGLAGVLAIAPGHVPDVAGFQDAINHDHKRAKAMIDAGKGGETVEFRDVNQGKKSTLKITASIYHSWFDPKGAASMPAAVRNLKPDTPILWIIGEKDGMNERGEAYAFAGAPAHPKNLYKVVSGGHKDTPQAGEGEIIAWLKGL